MKAEGRKIGACTLVTVIVVLPTPLPPPDREVDCIAPGPLAGDTSQGRAIFFLEGPVPLVLGGLAGEMA